MLKNLICKPLAQIASFPKYKLLATQLPCFKHFSSKANNYFTSTKFNDLALSATLKQALEKNNLQHLTTIQNLCLQPLLEGHNAVLHAETGSGKTLCYIIPILNKLLSDKASPQEESKKVKGALILAPNKELCAQIYDFLKILDTQDTIKTVRLGSLGSEEIEGVSKEKGNGTQSSLQTQNIVKNVNWDDIDVLISTPVQLANLLEVKDLQEPSNINPQFVAVDEYDVLLGNPAMGKATISVLVRLTSSRSQIYGRQNRERQFFLCGASAPRRVGSVILQEQIQALFKKIQTFQTEGFHKLPKNIKYEYIDIKKDLPFEKELILLQKLLKLSEAQKILIFCNSIEKVDAVYQFLIEKEESCVAFYAGMSAEERIEVLSKFNNEDIRILIATDLASRGIDFKNVDQVIQFHFGANAVAVLHRAGRTGRQGRDGVMTSFVREKDELLASMIGDLVENNEGFESAFSHKRSLRKKERRRIKDLENDE